MKTLQKVHKKRGAGEGSIKWSEDRKKWRVRLRCKDEAGRSVQKSIGWYASHDEARLALAEAVRKRDDGMAVGSKSQSMQVFLDTYIEMRWSLKQISETTYGKYLSINRLHLKDIWPIPLNRLNAAEHLNPLWARKVAETSETHTRDMRSFLVTALNYAVKHHLVFYNEAALSESPRFKIPEFQVMETDEEFARFKAAVKGAPYEVLYLTGLYAADRRGELCGLDWSKIDWTERTITTDQQVKRVGGRASGGGRLVITPRKSDGPKIVWPLNQTLYQAFHDLWVKQGQPKEGLIFRGIKDPRKPLDPTSFGRTFKRYARLAGLPDNFRLHDLRHTAANYCVNKGGNTKDASVMLGHVTTRHTERYTKRLGLERKAQTAALMEKMGQENKK